MSTHSMGRFLPQARQKRKGLKIFLAYFANFTVQRSGYHCVEKKSEEGRKRPPKGEQAGAAREAMFFIPLALTIQLSLFTIMRLA